MALKASTIQAIKKALNLTTDDFAGILGMNPVTIKGWMNGASPKLPTVILLETLEAKLKKVKDPRPLATGLKKTKKEKRLRWLVTKLCP